MKIIFALVVMFFSLSAFSLSMKIEGGCAGHLADGTSIAFQYYSNWSGCSNSSKAAISYDQGREGMVTGTRSFTEKSDIYNFGKERLTFANSTGNTSGRYSYLNSRGKRQTVTLQCDVRDYHYGECE